MKNVLIKMFYVLELKTLSINFQGLWVGFEGFSGIPQSSLKILFEVLIYF